MNKINWEFIIRLSVSDSEEQNSKQSKNNDDKEKNVILPWIRKQLVSIKKYGGILFTVLIMLQFDGIDTDIRDSDMHPIFVKLSYIVDNKSFNG